MIENKNDASRNLEKALQALEQAKQYISNRNTRHGTVSLSWPGNCGHTLPA